MVHPPPARGDPVATRTRAGQTAHEANLPQREETTAPQPDTPASAYEDARATPTPDRAVVAAQDIRHRSGVARLVNELKSQVTTAQRSLQELRTEVQETTTKVDESIQDTAPMKERIESLERHMTTLQRGQTSLNEALAALQRTLENDQVVHDNLRARLELIEQSNLHQRSRTINEASSHERL